LIFSYRISLSNSWSIKSLRLFGFEAGHEMERLCHINYVMLLRLTRIRNKDIGFGKNKDQLKKEKKKNRKKDYQKKNQIHH